MTGGPQLTSNNLLAARKLLFTVTSLLDERGIRYHLEGGTLLGIVRDQDLLPWDHDVDISIPVEQAEQLLKLRWTLLLMGYKMSVRKSQVDAGPIRKHQYSVIKIKPLAGYLKYWLVPPEKKNFVVLDIFMKTSDATHTYWQAKDKVMRVERRYYHTHETVDYLGHAMKVPNDYRGYLTEKYGDWSIPVREWDCGENELTIVKN